MSREQEELHILDLLRTQDTPGKEGSLPWPSLVSAYSLPEPWPQIPLWSPYLSLLCVPAPLQTELGLQKPHSTPKKAK